MVTDVRQSDQLIEFIMAESEIKNSQRLRLRKRGYHPKPPKWSEEEDQFLRENFGLMTDAQIGNMLGRAEIAVHLRWTRDLQLPAPSKTPGIVTGNQAAKMLDVDEHAICYWVDAGLIHGWRMPGERTIRLIRRVTLMRFACAPRNWIWFDPRRVGDAHLKRLIRLEMKRWGDEWWSTRQAGDYHGVEAQVILTQIQHGNLRSAVQLPLSRSGRHADRKWSNWFVLKSEVTAFRIPRKGDLRSRAFTPAADRWILRARDKLGMSFVAIGRTMKRGIIKDRGNGLIAWRYHQLKMGKQKGEKDG